MLQFRSQWAWEWLCEFCVKHFKVCCSPHTKIHPLVCQTENRECYSCCAFLANVHLPSFQEVATWRLWKRLLCNLDPVVENLSVGKVWWARLILSVWSGVAEKWLPGWRKEFLSRSPERSEIRVLLMLLCSRKKIKHMCICCVGLCVGHCCLYE